MLNDALPRRRLPPEVPLVVVLVISAICVIGLVLFADSESRDAQAARGAQVRALAADRALLELQLAARDPESPRT